MRIPENIPPSIGGVEGSKAGQLKKYVAAAAATLVLYGCANNRMPAYDSCGDAEYTHNLATTLGKSMEELRIINEKLRGLRSLDKKGGDSNSEERINLQGKAKSLEVSIKNMQDALKSCGHRQSMRYR